MSNTGGSAGGEHSLFLHKDGRLFSAGGCGLGWCRLDELSASLLKWRPVNLPEAVSAVHAGYYHNLAVGASSGKLYTWGCGTFTEPNSLDGVVPALGPHATTDRGEFPQIAPLPSLDGDRKEHIAGISGGAYHSIVWLKPSGNVYTFGAGQLGQLGRRLGTNLDESNLPVDPNPRPVEGLPSNDPVTAIGGGFYNTLAICKSKSLYCAGENQNQQCGEGLKNLTTMTKVKEVKDVTQVAGGYCHTLIKNSYGKVFSMGCGEDGQRGDGRGDTEDDESIVSRPVVTPVSLHIPATQVAAGANHSVVLGVNGVAYTFGANDVGQCGIDSDNEPVLTPQPINTEDKVVRVSAGYAHTVLTTASGRVLVFGQNDNGQLGLGNGKSHTRPVKTRPG